MINFTVNKQEARLISKIANRAYAKAKEAKIDYPYVDAEMDITACHANGCRLQLGALLGADDFNFVHDVFGIHRHINRKTGQLENLFVPRYAVHD